MNAKNTTIASIDVPQQDDLAKVRSVVAALHTGTPQDELSTVTGISKRHTQYTLHAARVLGWVMRAGQKWLPTRAGVELLDRPAGSVREREYCRRTIDQNQTIRALAPGLLAGALDIDPLATRLQSVAGLSASTAQRRALTLITWRDALAQSGPAPQMSLFG